MFAHHSWKETATKQSISHFSPIVIINIVLLFALLVTSCAPAQKTTPAVEKEKSTSKSTSERQLPVADEHKIPVYDRPEPRIASDLGSETNETSHLQFTQPQAKVSEELSAPLENALASSSQVGYRWHTFYGPSSGAAGASAMVMDDSGNIYLTGSSSAAWNGPNGESPLSPFTGEHSQTVIMKLNSAGEYQWHTFYPSYGPVSIAIDHSGNLVIVGSEAVIRDDIVTDDIWLLKLNNTGVYQWFTYSGEGETAQHGSELVIDEEDNIIVTGGSYRSWGEPLHPHSKNALGRDTGHDIVVMKFSSGGVYKWHTYYGSSTDTHYGGDFSRGITTDASGNIIVTGNSTDTWGSPLHSYSGGEDFVILKLNGNGTYQWHTFYGSSVDDAGGGVALDSVGNIVVAGTSESAWLGPSGEAPVNAYTTSYTLTVLKLSSGGVYQWHTFHPVGSVIMSGAGERVTLNSLGEIYVSTPAYGTWSGPHGEPPLNSFRRNPDITLLKLNNYGIYQWHTFYGSYSGPYDSDYASDVAVDAIGNVVMAGVAKAAWNGPGGAAPLNAYRGDGDIVVISTEDPLTVVSDQMTYSSNAEIDSGISCVYPCSQGQAGKPINTRTGVYDYSTTDISVLTEAGPLSFERTYSSLTTNLYSDKLGHGWTHNHDFYLVLGTYTEGIRKITLKGHTANQYIFTQQSDSSTTTAEPGVYATLVQGPASFILTDHSQNRYEFDLTSGKLTSYTNSTGHVLLYIYDTLGRLEKIRDQSDQRFLSIRYSGSSTRITSVTDHTGTRGVTYHYDASGDLDYMTDVLGQTWSYEYQDHRLTRVAAPGNVTVERTDYDEQGRAWRQYIGDADGDGLDDLLVTLTYNANGTTTVTDASGNTQTHTYDGRGTLRNDSNQLGTAISKTYDLNFRPETIQDANGASTGAFTSLKWSNDGSNLEYIKDALNGKTFIKYENSESPSSPTSIIDPLKYETKYFYPDSAGSNFPTLPIRIEYPLSFDGGATWIGTDYEYYPPSSGASAGKVKFITDARDHTTYYTYTSTGQIETVTTAYNTASELTTAYQYDVLGRMVKVTDPAGVITRNKYDAAGRLTVTINNVNPSTPDAENPPQNLVSGDNIYNVYTRYYYDPRDNQIAVVDTEWNITRTYYDLADRSVGVVQNLVINGTPAASEADVNTAINTPFASVPAYDPNHSDWNIRTATEYDDAGNLIVTHDPEGIITRTYYDEANRPKLVIENWAGMDLYGDISSAPAYSSTTPDQNVRTEYFYDLNNNQIATKDTLGVITRTYYDALNRPTAVVQNLNVDGTPDENDINTALEYVPDYDSAHPDRNLRTYTYYDANGNVIATKDPRGAITRTYYDALNRPIQVVQNLLVKSYTDPTPPAPSQGQCDSEISPCSFTYYDKVGNVIATVDPIGIVTRTYYDEANRPVSTVQNLVWQSINVDTPPERGTGTYILNNVRTDIAYGPDGRRDTTTDPREHVTKYIYNDAGQLLRTIVNYVNGGSPQNEDDQLNIVNEYSYDALGRQIETIDTLDRVTFNVYDDLGRVTRTTQNFVSDPSGYHRDEEGNQYNLTTTYDYDARSNQIAVTDSAGVITRTYYDAFARPVTVVRNLEGQDISIGAPPERGDASENLRTDTVYLGTGSVDYVLDEMGTITDYTYDSLGRLINTLDPLQKPTSFAYDANGNRTSMTDAEGVITRYEYDPLNRLTAVVEDYNSAPEIADHETNVRTKYDYDRAGRRVSMTDGNDHVSTFGYNELNIPTWQVDSMDHIWWWEYDANGNLIASGDPNGVMISYQHDWLNRLTLIDYPDPDADVTFDYDPVGRRTSMNDGLGTTTWEYNNVDLPKSITDPFTAQVSYEYDEVGNRKSLTYPDRSTTLTYDYNDVNLLTSVTSGESTIASYQYDPVGRLKIIERANGVNTLYNYHTNGWLQNITHSLGTTTLASYQYQYDEVGNRTQAIEEILHPVMNTPPQFELGSDAAINEGSPLTRSVAFTDPGSSQWELVIDYGDGSSPSTTTLNAEGNIDLSHTYVNNGVYTLSVTLTDDEQATTSDSILVTVDNVAPVVNAGVDQSVHTNETVAVNAAYSDAGTSDTHTATIDWGDGNSGPVDVTPGAPGNGTITTSHSYTATGNYTVEICVTDSDSGAGCDTLNVEVLPPPSGSTEIKIGETFILNTDNDGDANLMVAQNIILSQEATIQSLSFYVAAAAGNLRLGIYNDAGNKPGSLITQTDEFTPVAGWNTQAVQTPTLLAPGTYWLAYLAQSNNLHSRAAGTGSGENSMRYYSYSFGAMPATFSSSAPAADYQVSFYATLMVAAEPGTTYIGEMTVLHGEADTASNLLITQKADLPHNAMIQSLSFYVSHAAGKVRLGIYDMEGTYPRYLLTQTDEITPVVGWNTVDVQTPTLLPAGTYWLAFLLESDELEFKYEANPGQYTGRAYGYAYGALPASISVSGMNVAYRYSIYATLGEDASMTFPTTAILDDFNRADGGIGSNWAGETNEFSIASNQLTVSTTNASIAWSNESFGADQEAYVTLSHLDTSTANEHVLNLKAQSDRVVSVVYDGAGENVEVWGYASGEGWEQFGDNIPVAFVDGDVLGARALADGWLDVYLNGSLIAKRNLTAWPYYADGGYIGLGFENARSAIADDFGGGTLAGGESLTLAPGSEASAGVGTASNPGEEEPLDITSEFVVLASQSDVEAKANPFLATAVNEEQQAYVIFAPEASPDQKQVGKDKKEKSQQKDVETEGSLQVLFDLAGGRIQVLKYDSQTGWVQQGKDMQVEFMEGDRFRAQVSENDVVEIYRNGTLVAEQKWSSRSQQKMSTNSTSEAMSRSKAIYQPVSYRPSDTFVASLPNLLLQQSTSLTITYDYDPLYRLKEANYSNGDYYHYGDDSQEQDGYDAVGNRLWQETRLNGVVSNTTYMYDDSNRLISVNGVTYTWDDAGNLLNDGVNAYTYDTANRMISSNGQGINATYVYTGLGDRIQQTVNGNTTTYTLDLNAGLTQVLDDGTNTYLYGVGRFAQVNAGTEYFLDDALGSVRQLTNSQGNITLAKSYAPYGEVVASMGSGTSPFAFTGEQSDSNGLTYLRARYYASYLNQFIQPDKIVPDPYQPMDWNEYLYARDNPINYTDPSGLIPCSENQTDRYCMLDRGGYIDLVHFRGKKARARTLIDQDLPSQFGKTFGQIPFSGALGSGLPPTHFSTYYTRLPKDGLPMDQLERIALGIIMDYEYGFEKAQVIDPRCYSVFGFISHCSSFSNEDLPSDYLGIVSTITGLSLETMLMPNLLGPGEQINHVPAGYWGFPWPLSEPVRCSLGFCSNMTPFNDQCTFKVFDSAAMGYYNRPWPAELTVQPYGYRVYWARNIGDFTNFAIPAPIAPSAPQGTPIP